MRGFTKHQWGVLAAAVLALGMMTIDVSIIRVALPTIQNELNLTDSAQQWIVNAYLLTMGTLAIAGGRAGDRIGRRGIFLVGVVVFIVCSVIGGLSDSGGMLIAARAGQGVGAAIMTPGNTAMVTDAFSGTSLAKAMGILVGVGTIGVSAGALLGGFLIEVASWRWIFFINVPVAMVLIGLVIAYVPESRAERPPGLDPAGLATLVIGMTALTLALVQAPVDSMLLTVAILVFAALVLAAWYFIEGRVKDPLVDPKVMHGPMVGGNFVAFCVPFVLSGLSVLLAIYLQNVLDYNPLQTGLLLLPLTIPGLFASLVSGPLTGWLGARVVVTGGMAMAAIGVFAVGLGAEGATYDRLLPGLIVFALGSGVALPPMTATIMASAEEQERGMVSGVYNTARLIGATVGLAAMGSLLGSLEQGQIEHEQAKGNLTEVEAGHVRHLLAGGDSVEQFNELSKKEQDQTLSEMREIFDSSFATTLMLSSIVAAIGAITAFFVVPRLRAPPTIERIGSGPQPTLAEA